MGEAYTIDTQNTANEVIASLKPEVLGACDPLCGMSLTELRNFWWTYCYFILQQLPVDVNPRTRMASAETLLEVNNAVAEDFIERRVETRLGRMQIVHFGLLHLLPAMAVKFSPDLKTEVERIIHAKYGQSR